LYSTFAGGRQSLLPELAIQYADFAAWQRRRLSGEFLGAELAWWRWQLAGMPPTLDLPTDHSRPAARSGRGALHDFSLGAEALAELAGLSRRHGTTLFMTLFAAFAALLQRYTGEDDLVAGTPIAGRTRVETEPLIGLFVNTLVLRVGLGGDPDVVEILGRVRETALAAYAHQEVPFERLVDELTPERDLSRPPLIQVLFALQNAPSGPLELPGLTLTTFAATTGTSKLDLTCALTETESGLEGAFEYSRDLFDGVTVARLAGHFVRLLSAAAADPGHRLSELPMLSPEERRQLLAEWNDVGTVPPPDVTLHALFEAQAARTPEAVALVAYPEGSTGERWTYRELDLLADSLARRLAGLGIGPEMRVGVCLNRTPLLVASLLAVLKAGGAYVPLDPSYPPERLAFMLEDADAAILLSEPDLVARLPEHRAELLIVEPAASRRAEAGPRVASGVSPENLAYLIYTSGSTGRPKGVAIEHRSAVAFARWARTVFSPEDLEGVLAATSICFDLSVFELFVTLAWGGKVVLAANVLELPRLATTGELSLINTVPSAMAELMRLGALPQSVRTVNLAGEPLARSLVDSIHESSSVSRVLDLYGPSECTTYSTWAPAPWNERREPTIGRPIAGTRALLLGRYGEPVPVGATGEVLLGGAGLARGYLGRPELTAERFVPDPFPPAEGGEPGGRLYRTGDLARHLPDGRLEYLGRIDQQVKVRAFRIELGEIEAVLARHPEVRQAVVLAREDKPGDKRLVAYVVPFAAPSPAPEALREALRRTLPEYMVPAAFVVLPELPLTPNGKLDRRALPAPQWSTGTEPQAAQTPTEEILAAIWAAVLGLPQVSREDRFFDLGGHSLLATQVVARVREAFGVELPLRTLFERPKLADLARAVEAAHSTGERLPVPRLQPRARTGPSLPVSFAQERLWFLQQLEPGSATYNMPVAVELSGSLRPGALAEALAQVVRRHESLRTTFTTIDGAPHQRISLSARLALPLVDLSALPVAAAAAESERLEGEHAGMGFDLERGPLVSGLLVRLTGELHRFLLNLHHIIADGWSIGVLVHELGVLYAASLEERPSPLPELPIQYADFAHWQRSWLLDRQAAQLAYWESRLGGEIAPAELPSDRPRPAVQTFSGGRRRLVLSPDLTARLKSFGRGEGVTLFMTLLAATQALLSRHSGELDVPVGAPVAGRQWSETEGLIGCFLNTLVLRTDLSGSPSFRSLAAQVRTVTLEAYANQDVPFEAVIARLRVDRDLSRTPLFQVLFNLLNLPKTDLSLPGLDLRILTPADVPSKLDMTFYLAEGDDGVGIDLVYNSDLFDEARMVDVLAQLQSMLAQAVERPDESVDSFSLVTDASHALLPDPTAPLDASWIGGVHELFAAQAERAPERPAVVDGDVVWSYGDLLAATRGLAGWLASQEVGPGDPVAILAHRSAPLVPAVLGVLTAGAVFTILDPAYPESRLVEMLRLAAPRAWIALEAAGPVPEAVGSWLESAGCSRLELPAGGFSSVERLAPFAGGERVVVGPQDPACIGFTSGSTGGPKGILGLHGSLSHFLPIYCEEFELGPEDRFTLLSGLAHDPLQRDIFTPLYLGAAIVVPDPADIGVAGRLAEWMNRERVTVAHLTPALSQLLTERPPGGEVVVVPSLRSVTLVGEALARQDVARLREMAPEVTCFNLYGSTETQRALSFHRVRPEEVEAVSEGGKQVLPLGRGMEDVQLLVINRAGGLAGIGELGEIVVRSPHLARGYLGNAELTADRFQLNPFTSQEGDRIYRTGDLGRYLPDGEVLFVGRSDFQVKLRGFRIELGEIEALLARHPALREAAVLLKEDLPGGRGLVAYAVPATPGAADVAELHDYLWQRLPSYMVPSAFVLLDAMPLTPNAKVDRRALARHGLEVALPAEASRVLRSPVEEIVAGVCAEVLGLPQVGPDDNFFQLGGHSLTGAQVISRLRQALQVDLPLRTLFAAPTVAGMAAEIERRRRRAGSEERPGIASFRQERNAPPPLSFAQERFWAGRQLEAKTVASTIPIVVLFEGDLDLASLRRAMQEIVERHEVLRTSFRDEGKGPVQVVHPSMPLELPIVDLAGIAALDQQAEVQRLSTLDGRSPFDYERGPLFRMTLFRCSEGKTVVLFTIHHVAFDGWSTSVLLGELSALYNAFREGRPSPLRPLAAQYQDFARWQRTTLSGELLEEQVTFWRDQLRGAVPLDLAAGRPRTGSRSFEAGIEMFTVPKELEKQLDAFAAEHYATLFMTLLAAFKALLHYETGRDDIVVTCLFANRNQLEIENLIGNFYAGLPLRARLSGSPTFRELLERVRNATLAAHEHPDILYEPVMEGLGCLEPGDRGGLATFRILFQLAKLPPAEQELAGVKVTRLPFDTGKIRQDLSLFFSQSDELVGRFKYNRDVLDRERVFRMIDRFLRILAAAVAEPDCPLAELLRESPVLQGVGRRR
ncbi:MAG TPA: amino acid adenylation domain-containing protein, partial [Thermoanaerobaculia bacterium]|nr:amino acid adenylation domain-containing protein [Thermoanaerobaculia bacterium]